MKPKRKKTQKNTKKKYKKKIKLCKDMYELIQYTITFIVSKFTSHYVKGASQVNGGITVERKNAEGHTGIRMVCFLLRRTKRANKNMALDQQGLNAK